VFSKLFFNKNEFENIKFLLKNSLENTPDNIKQNHASIVLHSLFNYSTFSAKYKYNVDDAFDVYNKSCHKIDNLSNDLQAFAFYKLFSCSIPSVKKSENYDKIIMNDKNFDILEKYKDKIIQRNGPSIFKQFSDKKLQYLQNNFQNYAKFRKMKQSQDIK